MYCNRVCITNKIISAIKHNTNQSHKHNSEWCDLSSVLNREPLEIRSRAISRLFEYSLSFQSCSKIATEFCCSELHTHVAKYIRHLRGESKLSDYFVLAITLKQINIKQQIKNGMIAEFMEI